MSIVSKRKRKKKQSQKELKEKKVEASSSSFYWFIGFFLIAMFLLVYVQNTDNVLEPVDHEKELAEKIESASIAVEASLKGKKTFELPERLVKYQNVALNKKMIKRVNIKYPGIFRVIF